MIYLSQEILSFSQQSVTLLAKDSFNFLANVSIDFLVCRAETASLNILVNDNRVFSYDWCVLLIAIVGWQTPKKRLIKKVRIHLPYYNICCKQVEEEDLAFNSVHQSYEKTLLYVWKASYFYCGWLLPPASAVEVIESVPSVCLYVCASVRLSALSWLNRWSYDLDFWYRNWPWP